jgi:hypothetical protein
MMVASLRFGELRDESIVLFGRRVGYLGTPPEWQRLKRNALGGRQPVNIESWSHQQRTRLR